MGYSRSPVSVMRIQSELTELAAGRPCRWHRPRGDVDNWAYKVRQALRIAKRYPQQFPGLAAHADEFTIEILDDHTVQARHTSAPAVRAQAGDPPAVLGEHLPTHGLEIAGGPRTIVGVRSVTDIISQWLRSQPSNDALHFPDAQLSREDLVQLHTWARTRPVPWGIVRPTGTNALTLMPAARGTDVEFWTPETPED